MSSKFAAYNRIIINKQCMKHITEFNSTNFAESKMNRKKFDNLTLDFDEFLVDHIFPDDIKEDQPQKYNFRSSLRKSPKSLQICINSVKPIKDVCTPKHIIKPIKGIKHLIKVNA